MGFACLAISTLSERFCCFIEPLLSMVHISCVSHKEASARGVGKGNHCAGWLVPMADACQHNLECMKWSVRGWHPEK